jgi:MFS family permease
MHLGAAFGVIVVGLAQFLPVAVMAPFVGVLVDRLPRHWLLAATDVVRFVVSLSLSLIFSTVGLSTPLLVTGIVILRVSGVMFSPALQSHISGIARDEGELLRIDAWLLASDIISGMLGPVLAGIAITASTRSRCWRTASPSSSPRFPSSACGASCKAVPPVAAVSRVTPLAAGIAELAATAMLATGGFRRYAGGWRPRGKGPQRRSGTRR